MFKLWYGKIEGNNLHYTTHTLAGYAIAATTTYFCGTATATVVSIAIAIGKEVIDKATGKGTPEVKAAICTIGGAFAAIIIFS